MFFSNFRDKCLLFRNCRAVTRAWSIRRGGRGQAPSLRLSTLRRVGILRIVSVRRGVDGGQGQAAVPTSPYGPLATLAVVVPVPHEHRPPQLALMGHSPINNRRCVCDDMVACPQLVGSFAINVDQCPQELSAVRVGALLSVTTHMPRL